MNTREVCTNVKGLTVTLTLLLLLGIFMVPVAFAQSEQPGANSALAVSPGMSITISLVTLVNILLTAVSVGMWIQSQKEHNKALKKLFDLSDAHGDRLLALEMDAVGRKPLEQCTQRFHAIEEVQKDCLFPKLDPSEFVRKPGSGR